MSLQKSNPAPKVSVHMITFNHRHYIRRALESVLAQQTLFPFEIIVGEDCSSDGTRDIIREYAEAYKGVVRASLPDHNLGRCGEVNFLHTLRSCRGMYIAFLEGDDYWTEPQKLQIQVNFLDDHPDVVGCFHNAIVVDRNGNPMAAEWFDEQKRARLGQKNRFGQLACLRDLGSDYPSCSLMIRQSAVRHLPKWYLESPTDYATDILITKFGDLAYLPLNMGAYRIHPGGLWQGKTELQNSLDMFQRILLLYRTPELADRYRETLRTMLKWRIIQVGKLAARDRVQLPPGFLFQACRVAGAGKYFRSILLQQMRL